jgi:hypothetical protein
LLSPLPFLGAFAGQGAGDQGGLLAPAPFMGAFAGPSGAVDQGGFRSLLALWTGGAGSDDGTPPTTREKFAGFIANAGRLMR